MDTIKKWNCSKEIRELISKTLEAETKAEPEIQENSLQITDTTKNPYQLEVVDSLLQMTGRTPLAYHYLCTKSRQGIIQRNFSLKDAGIESGMVAKTFGKALKELIAIGRIKEYPTHYCLVDFSFKVPEEIARMLWKIPEEMKSHCFVFYLSLYEGICVKQVNLLNVPFTLKKYIDYCYSSYRQHFYGLFRDILDFFQEKGLLEYETTSAKIQHQNDLIIIRKMFDFQKEPISNLIYKDTF